MKQSRRAKRMKRHHARSADKNTTLNMVSLMDIFTILVFFLLVSTASSDILPTPKNIKLPRSISEILPKENVVIIVSKDEILLQGKKIAKTKSVINSKKTMIMSLFNELNNQAKSASQQNKIVRKGVTIMGDKDIPYVLLKKIMLTCSAAKFTNISFAVLRKPVDNT